MVDPDDILRIDPCWLCQPEAPKRYWQSAQWVASKPPWGKVTGDGIGRLRKVVLYERPKSCNYLAGASRLRLHCQWMTGKFATATVQWLPPGCTGVRKDQVMRATAEQIESAKAQCPACAGKTMTLITPEEAIHRAPWQDDVAKAIRVWADAMMERGDPIGAEVAVRLRRIELEPDEDRSTF